MLGEISTGLNLRVMKQGQDVKTSPSPLPPFLADIVLCCCVQKSIVRTKFISATCCIKFSWFEFVCHEAGT